MENIINDFAESIADDAIFEIHQSNFDLNAIRSPGPDDEDEEEENEAETNDQGSDDTDPPIDEDVVHSPLPPKTGGKPK